MSRREVKNSAVYLLFSLFLLPYLLSAVNGALLIPWSNVALNFLFFLVNFLAVTGILRKFLVHSGTDALKRPIGILTAAFWCLLGYLAAKFLVSRFILWVYPDFSNQNDESILQLIDQNRFLMILGTVFFVPLTEECLYRGFLFGVLRCHSRTIAYLVSVPVFCLIHMFGLIGSAPFAVTLLSFLQYIPAGIFLAYAYERADNIYAPILIHTAVNALGMIATR